MEIDPTGISKIISNYQNQLEKDSPTSDSEIGNNKDEVSLSGKAQELQAVQQNIDYSPVIREEKVAEIKQQIEEGNYDIDGEKVAGKMLDQIIDRRI